MWGERTRIVRIVANSLYSVAWFRQHDWNMSNLYAFMDGVAETAVASIRPENDGFRWTCECQVTGTAETATAASVVLADHRQSVHRQSVSE